MAWVVDTSVALDLHIGDPAFEPASTACLHQYVADGLVLCPISFAEVGPSFQGDVAAAATFFQNVSISTSEPWTLADTHEALRLWHGYVMRKRSGATARRPLADVLIASFAMRFQGIITRNPTDFQAVAPSLIIVQP